MANISGDNTDEFLRGVAGEENQIAGNGGNDTILGRRKNDLLLGGHGSDTIRGANGHDEIYGGADDDFLYGGNGGDYLQGDKGNNLLVGGNGNDTFGINAAIAGQGFDTIDDFDIARGLRAMSYNDTLFIKNAEGIDFNITQVANGDVFIKIDGITVAKVNGAENGATVTASALAAATMFDGTPASLTTNIAGDGGDNVLEGAEGYENTIAGNAGNDTILGADQADFLLGNKGEDEIDGGLGDDTIYGGGDNDILRGNNGADMLFGDAGEDLLFGGRGPDTLTGGADSDTFYFRPNSLGGGVDTITDFEAGVDVLELKNFNDANVAYEQVGGDVHVKYLTSLFVIVEDALAADVDAATLIS